MEKILYFLNGLVPCDKLKHSYYGNKIYILIFTLTYLLTSNTVMSIMVALITTIFIAYGKELYDKRNYKTHTYDIYDALYTIEYPVLYSILILLIKL